MARKQGGGERGYWADQIGNASTRWNGFQTSGERVVDKYMLEQNQQAIKDPDKYNILYSSTETVRPSLYAQTPKVEVQQRHRDRSNPLVLAATMLAESAVAYAVEEVDFDDVMENVVEDYTLPGLGVAWVRYDPVFKTQQDDAGKDVTGTDGKPVQVVDMDALALDYISWRDVLFGPARTWAEVPWVAKRVYMDKEAATKRFGADKANRLSYQRRVERKAGERGSGPNNSDSPEAIVWEIWYKRNRTVIWYSEDYTEGLLDSKADPLRLKKFFPTPRPLRAVSTTKRLQPRPFYSQYQRQADQLDNLTMRIRYLTDALYVRGVYDASQEGLDLLLTGKGNKMFPIRDWATFIGGGGFKGVMQFMPLEVIAAALVQLYDSRDRLKSEIYEITGFGDIMRGASKASETLGAQKIKSDWAGARLKKMQKEVQRYARDLIRIMGEIVIEHFSDASIATYAGFDVSAMNDADAANMQQQFSQALQLLRNERERCALIGIETDSTILPDEQDEREARVEFLGQAGAFLQQAGPMAMQYPEMRELLGALMMFAVRSFRAARPVEQAFETFRQKLAQQPATDPNAEKNAQGQAAAQATVQAAQIKAQGDGQNAQVDAQVRQQEIQARTQVETMRAQNEHQQAMVALNIKQEELRLREIELQIKQTELQIKQADLAAKHAGAAQDRSLATAQQGHDMQQDQLDGVRADREFDASREDAARDAAQAEISDAPQIGG